MERNNSSLSLRNPPKGSSFWNGSFDVIDTMVDKAIWEVNNGHTTLFWNDKWIDTTSFVDQLEWSPVMLWVKTIVGIRVVNYISQHNNEVIWSIP